MVETLDVNGSSILKTHRDPRPHPRKISLNPPGGFNILKPLGARSAGRGGKVSRYKGLRIALLRIKTQSPFQIPNKDPLSGQGRIWHLRTKWGPRGIKSRGDTDREPGAHRDPGWSHRAPLCPPLPPPQRECCWAGGTRVYCV